MDGVEPPRPRGSARRACSRILLTCRSIVRSLRHNASAMSLLVRPVETRRKHLEFTRRQRMAHRLVRRTRGRRIEPTQVGRGAESFELGPGSVLFKRRRLIVAERAAGVAR